MEAFASHRTDEGRDGRDDDDDDACDDDDDDDVGCDDDGAMREGGCACDSRARRVRRDGLEVHAWRDGARARWGRSRWRRWVRALTRASRGRLDDVSFVWRTNLEGVVSPSVLSRRVLSCS